jgi:putative ABC transport system permease protein
MFDLEQAIKKWKQDLAANPAMEDGYVAELEAHLRDRVEELSGEGVGAKEAFKRAAAALGGVDEAGTEFYKAHAARRSGRPPWQPPRFVPALVWNYLKLSGRRIRRHKGFSLINIAGMTVGLTCFILIMTFVKFELSFDRFHEKADRIYRFTSRSLADSSVDFNVGSSDLLGPTLAANVAAIGRATRVMDSWEEKAKLLNGQRSALLHGIYADEQFLKIFSFPLLRGDRRSALTGAGSVILSESSARMLFGNKDPIGRRIDYRERSLRYDLMVTAVMKDVPRNSHGQFDYVISVATLAADPDMKFMFPNWNVGNFATYIELLPGHAKAAAEKEIARVLASQWPDFKKEPRQVVLQPLIDIYLRSAIAGERSSNQRIQLVRLFISIAVVILLLACLNFTNLSTARSLTRAKEVALRKVVGAGRLSLFQQFVGESAFFSLLSFILALGLAFLFVGRFGDLVGVRLVPGDLLDFPFMVALCGAALLAGVVSGIYPGIVLSRFKAASSFQAAAPSGSVGSRLRRALVIVQFTAAVALIIAALVIFKQLHFIRRVDQGYDRERVVVIPLHEQQAIDHAGAIKTELLRLPEVAGATVSGTGQYPLSVKNSMGGLEMETEAGEIAKTEVRFDYVDEDFVTTMGLTLIQGRNFSGFYATDVRGILVNEALVRHAGWENPIGKTLDIWWMKEDDAQMGAIDGTESKASAIKRFTNPCRVLGVVRDFHFDTLHSAIQPAVLILRPGELISVRLRPGNLEHSMTALRNAWAKAAPVQPFDYFFLDDAFNGLYQKEQKTGEILGFFAILAIFIACLGLFGLAAFMAEQKTKEIGIRKVLGASARSLLIMLNVKFMAWVMTSAMLACSLAYFIMRGWLQDFAYKTSLGWGPFFIASLSSLAIALLTVSYQALKAARANPVDSLRYE